MKPPTRQKKVPIFFDEKEAYGQSSRPKKPKTSALPIPETRPAEDPPPAEVKQLTDQPTPSYTPPFQVAYTPLKAHWIENTPFTLFIKFLGEASITAIVAATNAHTANCPGPPQYFTRAWWPINRGELLCWFRLLFYIVNYTEVRSDDQWQSLRRFMSQERWEHIHRHLTFNINTTN